VLETTILIGGGQDPIKSRTVAVEALGSVIGVQEEGSVGRYASKRR
jgi:hypothetical protein